MFPLLPILLMQVGIGTAPAPISPLPPELQNRPARSAAMPDRAPTETAAIDTCLTLAASDPARATDLAEEWIARTTGIQRAAGNHCLGVAASNAGDWAGAADAFLAARADAADPRFQARMGALAGSALLAQDKPADALAALDQAAAQTGVEADLAAAIALDRAAALVALGRTDDAAGALAAARAAAPQDAQAWLLSATLARRTGDLATAQTQIEQAATLDPRDPAIGLEAGIIAALGQRDEAAAKSFRSVIAAAPDSPQAAAAQDYLKQLGQ